MPSALLASLVAKLTPGDKAVRLLPAGEFRAADGSGRPKDAPAWKIDATTAAALIARAGARADRRVVDYEHQTLAAASNGQPAPAAGWITSLEWREGDGLYAEVDWTPRAAAMIAAGEYRYLSPVFPYDRSGRVLDILHAGLTNNPGLDGLTDLAALSSRYSTPETPDMDLKKLLAALGLGDDKTEADALAALAALKAQTETDAARIATLTAAQPDPGKFVPVDAVAALQTQVAALSAQIAKSELDDLVEAGLADGRLNAALEAWARSLDVAPLKAYLDKAQPVAALKGTQTGGRRPEGAQGDTLSDAQLAVCKQLGVKPEEYLATLKAETASGG